MLSGDRASRFVVGLALIVGMAACGDTPAPTTSEDAKPPSATTNPRGSTGKPNAKAPEVGEIELDFARGEASELPAFTSASGAGTLQNSSYRLRLTDGDAIRAPATMDVEPGDRSVVVIATIRAPTELDGRAGVFCRGGDGGRSGYELSVDKTGRVRLERVENGRPPSRSRRTRERPPLQRLLTGSMPSQLSSRPTSRAAPWLTFLPSGIGSGPGRRLGGPTGWHSGQGRAFEHR